MNLKLAKYVIIILVLMSCQNENKHLTEYGRFDKSKDSLNISIRIADFETYGEFLNRLTEIVCNDSIPKIVIETENNKRNIYPIVFCHPPSANPRPRNTFYIDEDSIYKNYRQVKPEELYQLMSRNFNNTEQDIELAEKPEKILFIFDYYENKKPNGVEKNLELITNAFDLLETKNELKIIFGPRIDLIPVFENGETRYEQVK